MIDYSKFEKSLKHLQLQFENYNTLDQAQPQIMQEAVAESVIQRFETCYDTLWKILKRYLADELGLPEVPNSPKPVIRLAGENGLFSSSVDQWITYANARVATAHDYSEQKAVEALKCMEPFIKDAIALFEKLSAKKWEQAEQST